ncbi:MAG: hypothetical protein LBL34_06520 [Clostridiales bacterium]|nr:hypothetical protein [Clostridiales bacterium]
MRETEPQINLKALEMERRKYRKSLGAEQSSTVPTLSPATSTTQVNNAPAKTVTKSFASKHSRLKEFAELLQSSYYADSVDYVKELSEYADSHNVGMKEAYNSLYAERKYEELTQMRENNVRTTSPERQSQVVNNITKVKLNEDQLYVAKMSGMTPEEYNEYMN